MPRIIEGNLVATGLKIAIITSRWNHFIGDRLVEGSLDAIKRLGGDTKDVSIVHVPGCFELPMAAKKVAESGKYDAVIALGTLIRGATPHFDYVCMSVTDGLTRIALDEATPVAHGVLTTETEEQARDRDGHEGASEDKGGEAVAAALGAAVVLRELRTNR